MKTTDDRAANEFSRTIALGELGPDGVTREISADASEMAALARRFGLVAIDSLSAKITLEKDEAGHRVQLRGSLMAEVVQSCVVTLKPLANHVEGALAVTYTTAEDAPESVGHMAPDDDVAPGEDDLPELLEGDEIDLGELVAEHLGLYLDPYPRRSGVVFSAKDEVVFSAKDEEDPARESPFAVLRDLKDN